MRALSFSFPLALLVASCAQGAGPQLDDIAPQQVAVHETLRLTLSVRNAGGEDLSFRYEGPDLPGLERTASISGSGASGEFRWSPLSSHVGTHEFTFILVGGDGSEKDRKSVVIEVVPSADSAPVFLSPGAGGTYDLEREPCVAFDVEVRDDDTTDVDIRSAGALPDGADITREGPKRAHFEWCPSTDQIASAERWNVGLEADDGDHPPTEHEYIVVLRSGPKDGCPGSPPSVSILSPTEGERMDSEPGYTVRVEATDDMGLRDAPLLYWSSSVPDDLESPDVTMFEQVTTVADGADWRARIPPLGLADGAEQTIYVVVSATDNDDPGGTLCDHRTDSPLRRFVAVGGSSGGGAPVCDPCSSSSECASAVCATSSVGRRCLERCDGASCSSGTCSDHVTAEGTIARACGTAAVVCEGGGGGGGCTDDGREPNDSIAGAATAPDSLTGMQICAYNDDYYAISASTGTEVTVTVGGFVHADGDLDLQLLSGTGTVLDSSASTRSTETASYCVTGSGSLYARVFGYRGAENHYDLSIARAAGSCCLDDTYENDDTRTTARSVPTAFDGTICPGDDDYVRFTVSSPSRVDVTITFEPTVGDLDLELYGPSGSVVGASRGTSDIEEVGVDVSETGTYVARILGYRDAAGDYLGEVVVTPMAGCTETYDCPNDQMCETGSCVSDSCTSPSQCPVAHTCPVAGPGSPTSHCGASCSVNADCRSVEACKWFPEGRYCGRRGSGQNGDACTTFASCGGQRACLPWPSGYCARAGCSSNSDCESGTWCVAVGSENVCVKDCLASDDICRLSEGYQCSVEYDASSHIQWVCIPE